MTDTFSHSLVRAWLFETPMSHYLAFETGGTKLVAGLADADGVLLETRVLRRAESDRAADSIARLIEAGRELLGDNQPKAVGFGYGGGVDRLRQRPLECFHEPGWDEVDPVALFGDAFQAPVHMENDCKVAALAEALLGAGKGARTVFYITLGTGVGGGLVRDGEIVALSDHGEAEVGHLLVEPGGLPCPCGRLGCLEAFCSGPGLEQVARAAGLELSGPQLIDAWRGGDARATQAVERAAEALGVALGAVMTLLAPQAIVVGGGVGSGNPDFVALAAERAKDHCSTYFHSFFRTVPAALGEAVVTQGAALLAARLTVVSP